MRRLTLPSLLSCCVVACCVVASSLLGACSSNLEAPATESAGPGVVARDQQGLGEVVAGYPADQERMLAVLINQARHSPTTPNMNECGDWTTEVGANVKLPPYVFSPEANAGARFSARHMSEVGCYQHDSCCVLGDAGVGTPGCVAPGGCSGTACQQTCDAGVGQGYAARYAMFNFTTLSGVSIARNVTGAYELWCSLMQSAGNRGLIYNDAGTEFGAGTWTGASQACTGAYWAMAYGRGAVTPARIPVASAMYGIPNASSSASLYFAANYYDPSGKAPRRATVVVAGHCFDQERKWGYDDNGTYETHFPDPDILPDGCHPYYFLYTDGDGTRLTYPTTGSLQVPVGVNVTCPLPWDPAAQLPADCETGEQQCPAGARRPCYTADTATLRAGECRQGTQLCRNGLWGACRDMVGPFPEACDGLDNNCDGQIDEGNPGGGASCVVATELGACRRGQRVCLSGRVSCVPMTGPTEEVCNGIDDDCDGAIDDGFGEVSCGQGECYRLVKSCVLGVPATCDAGVPTTEIDDAKDNDCDGLVDEDFSCFLPDGGPHPPRPVFPVPMPDAGLRLPCQEGIQRCQPDAGWGPVLNPIIPRPEVCDGEDNDCDGKGDNDREVQTWLGYDRCGVGECEVRTAARCVGGSARTCTPLPAQAEVCNGVDDNCDGTIDEGCHCRLDDLRNCYTGPSETRDAGVCHGGQRTCVSGTYTRCTTEVKPGQELCNGLDDDCDGVVDNACLAVDGGGGTGGGTGTGGGGGSQDDAGSGTGGGGGTTPGKGCSCAALPVDLLWLALAGLGLRRRRA